MKSNMLWGMEKEKSDKMKKIGLVGGTGPESTIMYYKELNTGPLSRFSTN